MSNLALNLVPSAVGQTRPQIISAIVANNTAETPLPTSFTDPLYVVSPTDSDSWWKVTDWPASRGIALPQAGAAVALFYDVKGVLRCTWWDGIYTSPLAWTPSWQTPTLLNSWTNQGGSFETAGYLKDSLGFVHLKGLLTTSGTTSDTIAFVLPSGYRPGQLLDRGTNAPINATDIAGAELQVATNGNVTILYTNGALAVGLAIAPFLAEN